MRYLVLAFVLVGCSQVPPAADSGRLGGDGGVDCSACVAHCTGPGAAPVDCVDTSGVTCAGCRPACMNEGLDSHRAECGHDDVVCYCGDYPCDDFEVPPCIPTA